MKRRDILAVAAIAGGSALAPHLHAQNKEAALFGAREAVQQMSLSPDGSQIAVLSPVPGGAGTALLVGKLGGALKPVLRSSGAPETLTSCRWSTETRIVCGFSAVMDRGDLLMGFSRYVSLNADGTDVKTLSAPTPQRAIQAAQSGGAPIDWLGDEQGGKVLMTRTYLEQETTGSLAASSKVGLGVDRVDTTTMRRSPVEQPDRFATEFITDGHGAVRVRGMLPSKADLMGDTIAYQYRTPDSRAWRDLSRYKFAIGANGTGFNPYAVDRDLNVVYGFENHEGRLALFRLSLDGALSRQLVTSNPTVDVDGLIRIGRQGRVVGVSFATDRRQADYFDPELKRLGAGLSRALPGLPIVSFADASADEAKLLIWAGADTDPGRWFLYDKATRKLGPILASRPQLDGIRLATVKPVTFAAADGTPIPGYLTLPVGSTGKSLPTVVMPHGGPGARDEWGFDWLAQYLAARGFAVLQPNFRGSTGYGEGWFQKNGFQSWRTAIGDVNDGGRWLVKQGIADASKLAIVGWSYGGYAALQSAVLDPDLFKAIVAIAPVTDLDTLREDSRGYSNFTLVDRFIGNGPHVREGSPARNVDRIKAPVLMFHGDRDQNVRIGESRLMQSRLKGAGKTVEFVEFPGLDHYLEDDRARTAMLTRADTFLRGAMGM